MTESATAAPHTGPGPSPRDDLAIGVSCRRRYVIASIQRSGSSLLCWALWSSGQAGAPNEYLNPLQREHFETRWGALALPQYLEQLERHRTSSNGIFGLKVHFLHRLRWVDSLGHNLALLLPDARWVAITRRDRLAQAVSLEIARQTGRWSSQQEATPRTPVYSSDAISRRLDQIQKAERGWAKFFELNHITPLQLTYEEIIADPSAAVEETLRHLGVAPETGAHTPTTPPRRQSDKLNAQWAERYRSSSSSSTDLVR